MGEKMIMIKDTEKEIKEIDDKISKLKQKKKKLTYKEGLTYCPICKKFYPDEKCRQGPIMSGGFLEEWEITCPKGHTWDDK